ncbi:aminotransferase class V-fold PLP-dependent enzyme [Jonesiaceae bacterium BS-20]|uniref:Aminotransferase class V-fold PLP-dependent enzyme n=1 Tax=Jonesiaceae bacterium BS-20 TaxID=3120821 RepID=A0AAU7DQT7_9MICO
MFTDSATSSSTETILSTRANLDAGGNARQRDVGLKAYNQALQDGWADPRRLHFEGRRAGTLLSGAREACASVFGVTPQEIHFAPSPAVAMQTLVAGVLAGRARVGKTAVTGATERAIILNALAHAQADVHSLSVDTAGRLEPENFSRAIATPGVALAITHHGNHEVGTIQPIAEFAAAAKAARVPLLLDACASVGQIPIASGWDGLVANPADWGAGQGIAIVALKARTRWRRAWPEDQDPLFPGGVSVPAAFAAAVTLQEAEAERVERAKFNAWATAQIIATVQAIDDCEVIGDQDNRLAGTLTFSCLYVDGEALTSEFDRQGFAVGSGSACTSLTLEPSHVLGAMGVLTHGNIRIGIDHDVTAADIDRFCRILPGAIATVRDHMGAGGL